MLASIARRSARWRLAADEFLEVHDPRQDARRRDIGAPRHRMPHRAVGKPALHQYAGRIARRGADRHQIVEPAEPVPLGQPLGICVGREPVPGSDGGSARRRIRCCRPKSRRHAADRQATARAISAAARSARVRSGFGDKTAPPPAPARHRPGQRANETRSPAARPATGGPRLRRAGEGPRDRAGFHGPEPIARGRSAGIRETGERCGRAVRRLRPFRLVTRKPASGKRTP